MRRRLVIPDESLPEMIGRLVDETRALASAEVALAKARVGERVAAYKSAIVFFAIAGVLALVALIGLVVGAIIALATVIGPLLATLAVVVVLLAIAGALAMVGKGKLKPALPVVDAAS